MHSGNVLTEGEKRRLKILEILKSGEGLASGSGEDSLAIGGGGDSAFGSGRSAPGAGSGTASGTGAGLASGSGTSPVPVSGASLAARLGVSRQVIVQDIALLRADNKGIMSTYKGYILHNPQMEAGSCIRVFCVSHSTEDTLDEFQTIVDFGGRVLDVSVEHGLYGHITVDLFINNRLDSSAFVAQMGTSRDQPLKVLTGGCHYHTVAAGQERNLDLIEEALKKKGYLVHD